MVFVAGDFPFPSGTAAAARLRNLAHGFAARGYDVHVAAFGNTGSSDLVAIADGITCSPAPGAPHPFRNTGLMGKIRWLSRLRATAAAASRRAREKADGRDVALLILYGRSFALLRPLLAWARSRSIPVILDSVEANSSFVGFGGRLSPVYWDWALGERLLPRKVDAMSVITRTLGESARSRGCRRTYLLPSAEDFGGEPAICPASSGPFRIAYVGALLPRDNPGYLADLVYALARRGTDVTLDVAGRYEAVAEARPFVGRLAAHVASGRVNLHGRLSDEALASLLARADALVLPRRDAPAEVSAFPTRLAECLKTARPVLVSAVGDIAFHLRDGEDAILLDPADPDTGAAKVAALAASPDRGRALGVRGYLRARERFDRITHARELIALADDIRRA